MVVEDSFNPNEMHKEPLAAFKRLFCMQTENMSRSHIAFHEMINYLDV